MFKINFFSKKLWQILWVLLLVLTALPIRNAYAAGPNDEPPPPEDENNRPRLKLAFQRLKIQVIRESNLLDRCALSMERAQKLIDIAAKEGLDATALQAALDKLVAVLPEAKISHAEAVAIVEAHSGFDADGNVTDPDAAMETINNLRTKLRTTLDTLDGTPQALLRAIRDFVAENRDALRPEEKPES